MKDWAKNFYTGSKWRKCRAAYIAEREAIDGGLCEECGEQPGYIVHHKVPLDKIKIQNPDIALNFSNLEFVCKKCHDCFEGHFYKKTLKNTYKPRCFFDHDGDPLPPDP